MSTEAHIEQAFPIQCKGRDSKGNEVLRTPADVKVTIFQSIGDNKKISSAVECVYNTGGHGQRCKAPNLVLDTTRENVHCPYAFDIPYALNVKKGR